MLARSASAGGGGEGGDPLFPGRTFFIEGPNFRGPSGMSVKEKRVPQIKSQRKGTAGAKSIQVSVKRELVVWPIHFTYLLVAASVEVLKSRV